MNKKMTWLVVAVLAASAAAAQANLLTNYGFEASLSMLDWSTTWGSRQFVRETWNSPPEGSYAIYFKGTWDGGDNWGGGLQVVNNGITPGQTYNLSGQFYWDNGWSAASQLMKLEFFDAGNNLLQVFSTNLSGLAESTWQTRGLTATAPAGSSYAQVVLEGNGFGGAGVLQGLLFWR